MLKLNVERVIPEKPKQPNSNTTLVKVKYSSADLYKLITRIQIQHLLKLNQMEAFIQESYMQIQIQHLLKLNLHQKSGAIPLFFYSNTTLVKVKLYMAEVELDNARFKYNTC